MAFTFTDPALSGGQPIKRTHFKELVDDYKKVEGAVAFVPAVSNNPKPLSNTFSKITLDNLRSYVNQLETKFSNNCNCLTNANCCQTCQGNCTCQAQCTCQSQTCQTCQGGSSNCSSNCSDGCGSH